MKIKIIKNTYPKYPKAPHADPGDICHWEYAKGVYRLIRESDGKSVFASAPVNKGGLLQNGDKPNLVGVVGQVKSKGWVLEVAMASKGSSEPFVLINIDQNDRANK